MIIWRWESVRKVEKRTTSCRQGHRSPPSFFSSAPSASSCLFGRSSTTFKPNSRQHDTSKIFTLLAFPFPPFMVSANSSPRSRKLSRPLPFTVAIPPIPTTFNQPSILQDPFNSYSSPKPLRSGHHRESVVEVQAVLYGQKGKDRERVIEELYTNDSSTYALSFHS